MSSSPTGARTTLGPLSTCDRGRAGGRPRGREPALRSPARHSREPRGHGRGGPRDPARAARARPDQGRGVRRHLLDRGPFDVVAPCSRNPTPRTISSGAIGPSSTTRSLTRSSPTGSATSTEPSTERPGHRAASAGRERRRRVLGGHGRRLSGDRSHRCSAGISATGGRTRAFGARAPGVRSTGRGRRSRRAGGSLSRRLPRETRERLLADQFRAGTDWTRTRAFAILPPTRASSASTSRAASRKDRRPRGPLHSAPRRARGRSATLVDPEDRRPAVVRTTRTTDAFACGPPRSLPDLWVEWKPGRFMTRVVHPRGEIRQGRPDFYRRSDHGAGFLRGRGSRDRESGERRRSRNPGSDADLPRPDRRAADAADDRPADRHDPGLTPNLRRRTLKPGSRRAREHRTPCVTTALLSNSPRARSVSGSRSRGARSAMSPQPWAGHAAPRAPRRGSRARPAPPFPREARRPTSG